MVVQSPSSATFISASTVQSRQIPSWPTKRGLSSVEHKAHAPFISVNSTVGQPQAVVLTLVYSSPKVHAKLVVLSQQTSPFNSPFVPGHLQTYPLSESRIWSPTHFVIQALASGTFSLVASLQIHTPPLAVSCFWSSRQDVIQLPTPLSRMTYSCPTEQASQVPDVLHKGFPNVVQAPASPEL